MQSLKVIELFAGVGGFRIGLESSGHKTVWANQWEPKIQAQHAYNCYSKHFKDSFTNTNTDINEVDIDNDIPEHDLLVGGFPCQDYSVATVQAQGIEGKKGVLWWNIEQVLRKKRPKYVLLENVDRLLRSPTFQRGRDFGVILSCLHNLGYCVEWRVINAAEYGFPQKRKRTFFFAAQKGTSWYKNMEKKHTETDFIHNKGFFSDEFKVEQDVSLSLNLTEDIKDIADTQKISDSFSYHFLNAGFLFNSTISTKKVIPEYKGKRTVLGDILDKEVDDKYFVTDEAQIWKWKELKNAKKKKVKRKDGGTFFYSEGSMPFPEPLEAPARTIITSEGGQTPSRFKHIISDPKQNKYRTLTPDEVEKICGFPAGWTNTGMPDNWRYFCMGNALVVGLIEKMGKTLNKK
jgi:DNA (cytosine-5)-methyltransferase 1